jgi:general secretion pathway protein J
MKASRGFTLIELLVALVVFAAMAAAAYGGLASIARARAALAAQQDRFAAVTRTVSLLERDLRQGVSRTVLGNTGSQPLPALMGGSDGIEFTRLGYANPLAEPRSNLERVVYALDGGKLQRGRYLVLDRAPNSAPVTSTLLDRVEQFHLRYFGGDGAWRDAWPPTDPPQPANLPRAVEVRVVLADYGEIRRVVELVSTLSSCAVEASLPCQ